MLDKERHDAIIDILNKKKSVTVKMLSKTLFVSEATIRRDLTALEKLALLTRTHGGAVKYEKMQDELSLKVRENKNVKQKKIIAELASDFISDCSTVFIDSSSTSGTIIPFLNRFHQLTVITTGLKNALLLSDKTDARIYFPGGMINSNSNSVTGADTINFINDLNVNIAFISCGGIDYGSDVTESSYEQAQLKKIILSNAKTKVLLCDSSKFYLTYLCRTTGFDNINYLITDISPDKTLSDYITSFGCTIISPDSL